MKHYDLMKLQLESLSGGKTTVLMDDQNLPSIMVRIPKFNLSDVMDGAPDEPHPAFIKEGVVKDCIYISKYQNTVHEDRGYSLPFKDPAVFMTYDKARSYCSNKGENWHMMTNDEWAAIALWSRKNKTIPRGNTKHSRSHSHPHERGVVSFKNGKTECRTYTGSGPAAWSHDGTPDGIYDLVGNVWEYVDGVYLKNGMLYINHEECIAYRGYDVEDNNGAAEVAKTSNENPTTIFSAFEDLKVSDNVDVAALKALCLFPDSKEGLTDVFWAESEGERISIRGGYWVNEEKAGLFSIGFGLTKKESYFDVGFRASYYD